MRAARMRSHVDAVSAEVLRELQAHGVGPLLLKGPAITSLLYPADSIRSYQDVDLLVGPLEYETAERCLARMGFTKTLDDTDIAGFELAGHPWERPGGDLVDLHWTLFDVGAAPAEVWDTLTDRKRILRVDGAQVEAPDAVGCALIVALHAAHHGTALDQPLDDLARAVDRFDQPTWAAAAELAERLGATGTFTSGLTLHPTGERLASDLDLPTNLPTLLRLRRGAPPRGAVALEVLASTSGAGARLRIAARKVVPTRRFMRNWFPRSRRGSLWLAVGYLWRPLWLVLAAGPAFRAWRLAQDPDRRVRSSGRV
jgi:hypothetical protein